jgi:predicted dehydrogenase
VLIRCARISNISITGLIEPVKGIIETPDAYSGHNAAIRNFIDCLENGGRPETLASDNIHSLAMVHGAIESAKREKKIRLTTL